jgi:hypothetical protein
MPSKQPPTKLTLSQKLSAVLNSQFFLTFFALVVIGGSAALYRQYQSDLQDQAERRAVMGKLLTEYQHRVSELGAADSELNEQLGPSGTFDHARKLDRSDHLGATRWDKLTEKVSKAEWAVLLGHSPYAATAPEYERVSFLNVASQIDNAAGIPDLQFGTLKMIGILDAPPPATWLFVRSQMPSLVQWGTGRHLLYINQTLPLRRGQKLNSTQERQLGIVQPKPGELQRLERENDLLAERVLNRLENGSER